MDLQEMMHRFDSYKQRAHNKKGDQKRQAFCQSIFKKWQRLSLRGGQAPAASLTLYYNDDPKHAWWAGERSWFKNVVQLLVI